MSLPITDKQNLVTFKFVLHPKFEKEADKLQKRFVYFYKSIESFKLLCEKQFHPINPCSIIGPAKLHRVFDSSVYSIWKIELSPKGLRKNQSPRMWFAIKGTVFLFLCVATHIDNHDDNEMLMSAKERVVDYF